MARMTADKLKAIVKNEIVSSIGYVGGNLTEQRRNALDLYYQESIGNEIEGRSQYVTSDVQDTIESLMPDLMEVFAGSEEVVRFNPRSAEDVQAAEQATEYIQFIWNNDNDGFQITHDFIKDALLQKNGILKIWWDDTPVESRETLTGINTFQLQTMVDDEAIEIIEHDERPAALEEMEFAPDGVMHDVTITKTVENGRIKIMALPPEEFLIARRSVDLPDADFTCHKVKRTRSQLLQMGYTKSVVEKLPTYSEQEFNEERVARFNLDEEWPEDDQSLDPAQEEIWLYECYILTDYDGDGISEMRQVTVAGPGYEILDNQPVDDHPFVSITPIRMPHKFFGRSMADLVEDLQLVKTSLTRSLLDNLYFINNGRTAVSSRVNMEDMLTARPGGIVRVDTDNPDVGAHLEPIVTQPLGQVVMPALEYFDSVRETRTGVTRYNQGLDAESLNKTATGISQIIGQSQRRLMLIARIFSEMGFRPAFKKILRLVVNHQDRPRVIRLRNEWVPIDPRDWDVDMDVSVSVGLGHGTQQQRALMARMMLEVQERIINYQGGIEGPLVTLENVHKSLQVFSESNGFKGDQFFTDPAGYQPQEKGPSPAEQVEMGKLQVEQQKAQNEQQKIQIDAQEKLGKLQQDAQQFEEEMRLKWAEFEAKYNTEAEKTEIDRAKLGIEADKVGIQAETARSINSGAAGNGSTKGRQKIDASVSERFQRINEVLSDVSARMNDAVAVASRPREITRDGNGRISGSV